MKRFAIDFIAATLFLLGLLIIGADDVPVETDEEIHAIALAEQARQKAEFNRLTLEAQYKTGYKAAMK